MGLFDTFKNKLPSWIWRQPTASPETLAKLQEEVVIPIRNSFNTVRGWRFIDVEYTLGEGEAPRDSAVTAAIHKFDPDMVPLWARWRFLSPVDEGSVRTEIFGRHVVGRYLDNPTYAPIPLAVVMPPGYSGKVPNKIEFQWDGMLFGESDPRGRDLPGPFLPWDWRLYNFMQKAWTWNQNNSAAEKKRALVMKPEEARIAARNARIASQQDINRRLQEEVNKILNKLSDSELEQYFMGGKFVRPGKSKQVGYTGGPTMGQPSKIITTDS